jgi:translation initiation factor IF-2
MLQINVSVVPKKSNTYSKTNLFSKNESKENSLLILFNPVIIKRFFEVENKGGNNDFDVLAKSNVFGVSLDDKPNIKIDRKNKKVERGDERENENVKSKIKNKKKIKSNIEIEEEYTNTNVIPNDYLKSSTSDPTALSLARPNQSIKARKGLDARKSTPKNIGKMATSKKNKKNNNRKEIEETSTTPPEKIIIPGPISVQNIAKLLYVNETDIIRNLFLKGIGVTINQILDVNTAQTIGEDLGIIIEVGKKQEDTNKKNNVVNLNTKDFVERSPVIAIMGHVDHGKTTLLDKLRNTQTAQKEAGGITQRTGAYEVNVKRNNEIKKLIFLDTPGHEAFSGMRSRGIKVTDVAVLVVAADDGVKEQTIEIIKSIQKAKIPLIVAINKIDKENANIENIKQELTQYNVIPESWGGDTQTVPISAAQGTNIDNLLEVILLVAELEGLKANPKEKAQGTVLEANLDRAKGALATLLVQNGTLKLGDVVVAGTSIGKIRGMVNADGENINECGPSSPVLIWGLSEVPVTGDSFEVYSNEKEARLAVQTEKKRQINLGNVSKTISEGYTISTSDTLGTINLIIKTDIHGSIEAIVNTINKILQNKVQIRMLYTSPGEVTETDIDFANTSRATILAFNTTLASGAKRAARHLNVIVKEYDVIYDLFEDVEMMIEEITGPEYEEETIGQAIVKTVFPLGKNFVAGCYIHEGKITKSCSIEVIREDETVYKGTLTSLKQFKQDVGEVLENNECGIFIDQFNDWKEQDVIKALNLTPKKRI